MTTHTEEYYKNKIQATANGEDPLVAWIEYFNFAKKQNNKKEIYRVLKGCTSTFRNHNRYNEDMRYLQVWVSYAKMDSVYNKSHKPIQHYNYLLQKGIGKNSCYMYEQFANLVEGSKDPEGAYRILQDGLSALRNIPSTYQKVVKDFEKKHPQFLKIGENTENNSYSISLKINDQHAKSAVTSSVSSSSSSSSSERERNNARVFLSSQGEIKPSFPEEEISIEEYRASIYLRRRPIPLSPVVAPVITKPKSILQNSNPKPATNNSNHHRDDQMIAMPSSSSSSTTINESKLKAPPSPLVSNTPSSLSNKLSHSLGSGFDFDKSYNFNSTQSYTQSIYKGSDTQTTLGSLLANATITDDSALIDLKNPTRTVDLYNILDSTENLNITLDRSTKVAPIYRRDMSFSLSKGKMEDELLLAELQTPLDESSSFIDEPPPLIITTTTTETKHQPGFGFAKSTFSHQTPSSPPPPSSSSSSSSKKLENQHNNNNNNTEHFFILEDTSELLQEKCDEDDDFLIYEDPSQSIAPLKQTSTTTNRPGDDEFEIFEDPSQSIPRSLLTHHNHHNNDNNSSSSNKKEEIASEFEVFEDASQSIHIPQSNMPHMMISGEFDVFEDPSQPISYPEIKNTEDRNSALALPSSTSTFSVYEDRSLPISQSQQQQINKTNTTKVEEDDFFVYEENNNNNDDDDDDDQSSMIALMNEKDDEDFFMSEDILTPQNIVVYPTTNPFSDSHRSELENLPRFNQFVIHFNEIGYLQIKSTKVVSSKFITNNAYYKNNISNSTSIIVTTTTGDLSSSLEKFALFGNELSPFNTSCLFVEKCIHFTDRRKVFRVLHDYPSSSLLPLLSFGEKQRTDSDVSNITNGNNMFSLKIRPQHDVHRTSMRWEMYISNQLHSRLREVEYPAAFYGVEYMKLRFERTFILREYADYNISLSDNDNLNTIASIFSHQKSVNEFLVAFYSLELLSMLYCLLSCSIIHGKITPKSLWIMSDENNGMEWGGWQPNGSKGWYFLGLKLANFRHAIDLSFYSMEIQQQFYHNCENRNFRCIEMMKNKPWAFQIDVFGVVDVVHFMLFSRPIDILEKGGCYYSTSKFQRLWKFGWEELLYSMLNMSGDINEYRKILVTQISKLREFISTNSAKVSSILSIQNAKLKN